MSEWAGQLAGQAPDLFTMASMVAGTAFALFVLNLFAARTPASGEGLDPQMPWLMRRGWRASAPLLPLVRCLPIRIRASAARATAPERWAAAVPGDRWLAMRCLHAGLLAMLAGVLAWANGLPVAAGSGVAAAGAVAWSGNWVRRRRLARERAIARELPSWLDVLTVSIEAGSSLTAAMRLIVESAPEGPLKEFFGRVLRQVRAGRLRTEAFTGVAEEFDSPPLRALATALAHGEASGMSLGNVLRAQGAQRTAERFARAEKLAMEAPVKLLGPLILCIFPCTFIVLAVPIVVRLKEALGT